MVDKSTAGTPNSQTIWNAILTVIGAALLAALGFLYNEVITLKEIAASVGATRFTQEEAEELRSDITLTLTTVDKRMAIMENNTEWIQTWVVSGKKEEESGHESRQASIDQLRDRLRQLRNDTSSQHSGHAHAPAKPTPLPPPPPPSEEAPTVAPPPPSLPSPDSQAEQSQKPRYDLRQKTKD